MVTCNKAVGSKVVVVSSRVVVVVVVLVFNVCAFKVTLFLLTIVRFFWHLLFLNHCTSSSISTRSQLRM